MSERISIRDLAKLAGVSRTTVSLALRGSHEVSESTRKRIQQLAQEHGYRSHPAIHALMQQVGRGQRIQDEEVIAYIVSGSEPEDRAPSNIELLRGIRDQAGLFGYRIEVFWAGYQGKDSERIARILYHRGIRGVIWGPMPYPHPPIRFPWERFIPIACTPSTDVPNLPYVSISHPKAMCLLLNELTARGVSQIGFLHQDVDDMRHSFGWNLGIDLYQYQGGTAEVHRMRYRPPLEPTRIVQWIDQCKLGAVVFPHLLFKEARFLDGIVPRASLGVPRDTIGEEGGIFQDMLQISTLLMMSLNFRMANGILGIPNQSMNLVTDASFVWGKSLLPLSESISD